MPRRWSRRLFTRTKRAMLHDEPYVPISALQHMAFCPRQAALIHVEQVWADNPLTVEGHALHARVDSAHTANVRGARVVRRLAIWSDAYKLTGYADVVELLPDASAPLGWRPFPVEYKRGNRKRDNHDEVQVCAQALCLEERFGTTVPEGALFYGKSRRRVRVQIDALLRGQTLELLDAFRSMRESATVPRADRQAKCQSCSLLELCQPEFTGPSARRASSYLRSLANISNAG